MKYFKIPLGALLGLLMITWFATVSTGANNAFTQTQSTALERGYRTGYSDGYNAGYRDITDRAARDYQNKEEYQQANRSYNEAWGTLEDYRDGYQQGFEAGYANGYDRGPFNSSIPSGLARRGTIDSQAPTNSPTNSTPNSPTTSPSVMSGPFSIPRNAILVIELQSSLSTDASQRGDRFQARVIEPREYEGAIVDGRVTNVKRPGKLKGVAELQLSFETIHMPDNRSATFVADVVEVVPMSNRDEGGTVDSEGGVKGKNSTKDDVSRVGASTGIGAIIGAIFGGGKGAAIGAAIGAGVGTGGVLTQRGKDLRLARGQQLKIRTATETRIQ